MLQYKMVLADGSIAIVDDNTTTIVYKNGKRVKEIYDHDLVPNLRYGLRAAGPSFGIVTEFLYKVYPHPETLSCVVLVYVKTGKDLEKLVKAGQDGRYGISIIQPVIFRKPKPAKWVSHRDILKTRYFLTINGIFFDFFNIQIFHFQFFNFLRFLHGLWQVQFFGLRQLDIQAS